MGSGDIVTGATGAGVAANGIGSTAGSGRDWAQAASASGKKASAPRRVQRAAAAGVDLEAVDMGGVLRATQS
ncbi:hypothetical protein METY_1505 [Methylopila sp. Yamaguchi]|nr:hypothetical protein METY_1505 [Methylopila sp. Yamaguchi]